MKKMKNISTPNPGMTPGKTTVDKRSAGFGPNSSFGKPGKAMGPKQSFGEFSNHGNQRGR